MNLQLFFAKGDNEIKHYHRIQRLTSLFHKLQGRYTLREVVRHGIRWKLGYVGVGKKIIKIANYDWELLRYLFAQAQSKHCDVFLDVGAHSGYYSLMAAKVGLFKEIHAIEPIPELCDRIHWHIHANQFADAISVHQVATTDKCEMLNMIYGSKYSTMGSVVDDDTGNIKVQGATLDSLFDFRQRQLAMKIDVEGHEVAALRGAEKLFAQNDILLQIEVWNESTQAIEYLLSQGFKMLHYHAHASHYADFYFERKCT